MAKAVVYFPIKIFQDIHYTAKSKVYLNYKIEWKPDNVFYYSYWDITSAEVLKIYSYGIQSSEWNAYASILKGYSIDFGSITTQEFERVNSNIYKNLFETILYDLFYIQEQMYYPYHKDNTITQFNHGFVLYDIISLCPNGLYKKSLATEELYNAIGVVTQVINQDNFVLSTYGEFNASDFNINNITSDSGILYLSETNAGTLTHYERINNKFYTPVGFKNHNKVVINILDSSIGDTLLTYKDNIFVQNSLTFLTNNDLEDIVQEVLNHA